MSKSLLFIRVRRPETFSYRFLLLIFLSYQIIVVVLCYRLYFSADCRSALFVCFLLVNAFPSMGSFFLVVFVDLHMLCLGRRIPVEQEPGSNAPNANAMMEHPTNGT